MLGSLLEFARATVVCPAVDAAAFSGDRAKCPESVDKGVNIGVPVLVLHVHAETDLEMFVSFFDIKYRLHLQGPPVWSRRSLFL